MTMTSMIDERWRDIRIGNSRRTIGEHGSLLCCISEMLAQAGNPMNPASLNRWLAENGGYSSRGDLIFDAIQPLGIQRRPHTGDGQLNSTVAAIGIALRRGLGVLIAVRRGGDWYVALDSIVSAAARGTIRLPPRLETDSEEDDNDDDIDD